MSDQMPNEVWVMSAPSIVTPGVWLASSIAASGTRYIRADLYEQAEATLAEMCDKAETFVQRAEQAEAERDRLRAERNEREAGSRDAIQSLYAEVEKLRAALSDIADDPYDYQRVQDKAQEALSHD